MPPSARPDVARGQGAAGATHARRHPPRGQNPRGEFARHRGGRAARPGPRDQGRPRRDPRSLRDRPDDRPRRARDAPRAVPPGLDKRYETLAQLGARPPRPATLRARSRSPGASRRRRWHSRPARCGRSRPRTRRSRSMASGPTSAPGVGRTSLFRSGRSPSTTSRSWSATATVCGSPCTARPGRTCAATSPTSARLLPGAAADGRRTVLDRRRAATRRAGLRGIGHGRAAATGPRARVPSDRAPHPDEAESIRHGKRPESAALAAGAPPTDRPLLLVDDHGAVAVGQSDGARLATVVASGHEADLAA